MRAAGFDVEQEVRSHGDAFAIVQARAPGGATSTEASDGDGAKPDTLPVAPAAQGGAS